MEEVEDEKKRGCAVYQPAQWEEITKDFFHSVQELDSKTGELLHYELFGLFEGLYILQLLTVNQSSKEKVENKLRKF